MSLITQYANSAIKESFVDFCPSAESNRQTLLGFLSAPILREPREIEYIDRDGVPNSFFTHNIDIDSANRLFSLVSSILEERKMTECTPLGMIWERGKTFLTLFDRVPMIDCASVKNIRRQALRHLARELNQRSELAIEAQMNLDHAVEVLGCGQPGRLLEDSLD